MKTTPEKSAVFQTKEDEQMKEVILPMLAVYETNKTNLSASSSRKVWTFAAIVSSFLGATAGLAGLIFMILAYFEPSPMHSRTAGLLMIAVFPLFVLAAHSLDKIETAERAEKIAKLKKCGEKNIFSHDCK